MNPLIDLPRKLSRRGAPIRPLAGQSIVITGAGSGIGRALAQRLAGHGCPVALADINPDGLELTARSIAPPVLPRVVDVGDPAAMSQFADDVLAWLPGPLGAVFNNAGVAMIADLARTDPQDDAWLRRINIDGVIHGTRAFLPTLLKQDSGAIVNTSSVFGLVGIPSQTAYCTAKFAVRGFTEALRQELRPTGVRAITVHPGGISTDIVRNARLGQVVTERGEDRTSLVERFEQLSITSPQDAAAVIHRGVDANRARILIGPDAYAFDALARLAPTHYYDVLEFAEKVALKRVRSQEHSLDVAHARA